MIIILGACQPLGHSAAIAFAEKGARVVVIDGDPKALEAISSQNPEWIEPLAIENIETEMAPMLKDAWGAQRIDLVLNLLPLKPGARDISAQMRMMSAVVRTTLRGLVAGRGSLVTLVGQSQDPLAFVSHGMQAALKAGSMALADAVASKGVRAHCITTGDPQRAQLRDMLMYLTSPSGRMISSSSFDLDNPAP